MITSHYAEPVQRLLAHASPLLAAPGPDSEHVCDLGEGAAFEMLDDSLGWAWGYGGSERRVGYLPSGTLKR